MCYIIDKGLWMSGTFRRAMGALGADTAAHLHGRAAGCLPAAAADRLFMATEPDARCCHAVVVAGTGASRSQPLAAWRDRSTGPSEIPQEAGKRGTNGTWGTVSQDLFGREISEPRPLRTGAGCGMDSGLPPPPHQHHGDWFAQAAWHVTAASVQTERPKTPWGLTPGRGTRWLCDAEIRDHLWS